ncbi:hypothetical protein D3C79_948020 [compost metagenome]
MQHQAFDFRQFCMRNIFAFIMGERAQHPANGITQLAICIDIGLDDAFAEALIFPIIGRHDP